MNSNRISINPSPYSPNEIGIIDFPINTVRVEDTIRRFFTSEAILGFYADL